MFSVDLSQFTHEYASQGLGEMLYGFICGIVGTVCPVYPPRIYSPNGVWDEDAIDEVCQEFTLHKLIKAGNLEHHLYASENTLHLGSMIKRDLRQFLINSARRTAYIRLRKRAHTVLGANSVFKSISGPGDYEIWSLVGRDTAEIEQELGNVIRAMWSVPLPPAIRYRLDSKKESPLISSRNLELLLTETFTLIDKGISFSLLTEAIRYRLNLLDDEIASLNDFLSSSDGNDMELAEVVEETTPNIELDIETMELAVHLLDQFTVRQRRVLAAYIGLLDPNQAAIARYLGISVGTVNQELQAITKSIRAICTSPDEAVPVMQHLAELLADQQI